MTATPMTATPMTATPRTATHITAIQHRIEQIACYLFVAVVLATNIAAVLHDGFHLF